MKYKNIKLSYKWKNIFNKKWFGFSTCILRLWIFNSIRLL